MGRPVGAKIASAAQLVIMWHLHSQQTMLNYNCVALTRLFFEIGPGRESKVESEEGIMHNAKGRIRDLPSPKLVPINESTQVVDFQDSFR